MIYIGIDASSTNTGVVFLEKGNLLKHFLIHPSDKNILERCSIILKSIIEIISKVPTKDCKIAIEGSAYMARGKIIDLAMLNGAIFYGLKILGYDIILVPPTTHKKTQTGSGRANKENMIESLPSKVAESFYGTSKKIDDLADAYSLAKFISS